MSAATQPIALALREERYEVVALRLVLGVLCALEEAAPDARDELVALLSPERR